MTRGERAADVLKARFGSWPFLFALNAIFFIEISIHIATHGKFDPGLLLLNLFLSWLAAQQGGALQISANRGDRITSEVALHTRDTADKTQALLEANTDLTRKVHELTAQVRELVTAGRGPAPVDQGER